MFKNIRAAKNKKIEKFLLKLRISAKFIIKFSFSLSRFPFRLFRIDIRKIFVFLKITMIFLCINLLVIFHY